jgi:aldehyde dehydrogenase (NAD+)/betaine-aldehyde dehydrogenase
MSIGKKRWQNYIDGEWCDPHGGDWIPIEDPATTEVVLEAPRGQKGDIDAAVAAARRAIDSRAIYEMAPHDRMILLLRVAAELRKLVGEIVPVIVAENGKSVSFAQDEVEDAARYFEYYAGLAGKLHGRQIPLGEGFLDYTQLVPMGVIGTIIPWNFPLELAGRDLAPALACGNAVVVKSPELCPISLYYLAIACERAGMPKGYYNVVCGYGNEAGEALASHPGIDQIVFTGSVETGKRVAANAAKSLIPCVLELGGKGAGIVYADADLDAVAHSAGIGIYAFGGQVCSAGSRLIVHKSVEKALTEKLVAWVGKRTMGPGTEDHFFTPLISRPQRDKAEAFCTSAVEAGGRAVIGGKRPEKLKGYYLEPTIISNVGPDSKIAQNEVFGPVLTMLTFDTPEEALKIANGTNYGLTAGVYTKDLKLAHWTADRLQAGSVYVNKWYAGGMEAPFGGFKKSGFGRVKSVDALAHYYQVRNVAIKL